MAAPPAMPASSSLLSSVRRSLFSDSFFVAFMVAPLSTRYVYAHLRVSTAESTWVRAAPGTSRLHETCWEGAGATGCSAVPASPHLAYTNEWRTCVEEISEYLVFVPHSGVFGEQSTRSPG